MITDTNVAILQIGTVKVDYSHLINERFSPPKGDIKNRETKFTQYGSSNFCLYSRNFYN